MYAVVLYAVVLFSKLMSVFRAVTVLKYCCEMEQFNKLLNKLETENVASYCLSLFR